MGLRSSRWLLSGIGGTVGRFERIHGETSSAHSERIVSLVAVSPSLCQVTHQILSQSQNETKRSSSSGSTAHRGFGSDTRIRRFLFTPNCNHHFPLVRPSPTLSLPLSPADFSFDSSELTSRIPSVSSSKEFNVSRWSPNAISALGGLEVTRFRPNILVSGTQTPFEEDGWKLVKIGQSEEIEVCFRCARCMLPSVDPENGKRDKLLPDAVMKDRKVSKQSSAKVCFGMLSSPRKKRAFILFHCQRRLGAETDERGFVIADGQIKVGDLVEVLDQYPRESDGGYIRNEDRD